MTASTLRNTQIVRNVMNKYNPICIYTNKMSNGNRTVKCYGMNAAMRRDIAQVLTAAGITFEIRNGDGSSNLFCNAMSTIVEVPCNW